MPEYREYRHAEGFTEWLDDNICKCSGYQDRFDGYYFRTEDEALEGPFSTPDHAREAMDRYCKAMGI